MSGDFSSEFEMGNGLKALRERAGMTQDSAAAAFGMSTSGYKKIEGGHRKLNSQHIKTAMRVFDATEAQVLDENAAKEAAAELTFTRALSAESEASRRAGLARFLEILSDSQGGMDWLEIVEDLESAFRTPPGEGPRQLDLKLILDRAEQEAGRAIRRLRKHKEKKA